MEFEINQTPFKMTDISGKLFNLEFLSDITFIVEGKYIYAHSLELMKRSLVFQQQLDGTFRDKKIIPITDYDYATFYEFIRFIYTDECDVRPGNRSQLLKLANAYNVIRLVNVLINYNYNYIDKLNFCVIEKHKVALNDTRIKLMSEEMNQAIKSKEFVTIHPDTIEEILKLDEIPNDVKETDILSALVSWLSQYCIQNHIKFSECRQKFHNLIHLIRFPTLTTEELRDLKINHPDLLTNSDFLNIAGKKIYGTDNDDIIWNCLPRSEFESPFEWQLFPRALVFNTKFTVSTELFLRGFVFGSSSDVIKRIAITISCLDSKSEVITAINFDEVDILGSSIVVGLGESIRIHPEFTYIISYNFIHSVNLFTEDRKYWSRKSKFTLITNAKETVTILEAHATMLEIVF